MDEVTGFLKSRDGCCGFVDTLGMKRSGGVAGGKTRRGLRICEDPAKGKRAVGMCTDAQEPSADGSNPSAKFARSAAGAKIASQVAALAISVCAGMCAWLPTG